MYNDIELSDIKLMKKDESIIYCHKIILMRNPYFKKYILYCDSDIVKISDMIVNFDEDIIITYIKYLYDIDEIDYNNIIPFFELIDFINDNVINIDPYKIVNLKEILCNLEINNHIINSIVKKLTYD